MKVPVIVVALAIALAGCISAVQTPLESESLDEAALAALVSICLPGFHTYAEMQESVANLVRAYPGIARTEVVGHSVEGQDIVALVLTDESAPSETKLAALFDGQHHGDEPHAGENMLHLAWWIATNAEHPRLEAWLDSLEIWIILVVNPDGHAANDRHNANDVDLNRNYDVDWGNPGGTVTPYATTAPGPYPFSEPESRAIRDLTFDLAPRLAFYNTNHIARHSLAVPWAAFDPPFEIPPEEEAVYQALIDWTLENTEFEAGRAAWLRGDANLPYAASGTSMDWVYAQHRIPSSLFETYDRDRHGVAALVSERVPPMENDHNYWAHASLPVYAMLLENAAGLSAWSATLQNPELPLGIPPEPAIRGTPGVCATSVAIDDLERGKV